MIVALVFSLGILNASSTGLATLTSPRVPGPLARVADRVVRGGCRSTTDPVLPHPPAREAWTEADSNEAEDELLAYWLEPTSWVLNPAVVLPRHDYPATTQCPGDGLLHELHHSWQLRC
jgi:hypothetical protein